MAKNSIESGTQGRKNKVLKRRLDREQYNANLGQILVGQLAYCLGITVFPRHHNYHTG